MWLLLKVLLFAPVLGLVFTSDRQLTWDREQLLLLLLLLPRTPV